MDFDALVRWTNMLISTPSSMQTVNPAEQAFVTEVVVTAGGVVE